MATIYRPVSWDAARRDLARRKKLIRWRDRWMPVKERTELIVTLSMIVMLWVIGVFGTVAALAGLFLLDGTVTAIGFFLSIASITGICLVVFVREREWTLEPIEPADDLEVS